MIYIVLICVCFLAGYCRYRKNGSLGAPLVGFGVGAMLSITTWLIAYHAIPESTDIEITEIAESPIQPGTYLDIFGSTASYWLVDDNGEYELKRTNINSVTIARSSAEHEVDAKLAVVTRQQGSRVLLAMFFLPLPEVSYTFTLP